MSRFEVRHSTRNKASSYLERPTSRTTTTSSNSAGTSTATASKPSASKYLPNSYDRDFNIDYLNDRPKFDRNPPNNNLPEGSATAQHSLANRLHYGAESTKQASNPDDDNTDQLPPVTQGPLFTNRRRTGIYLTGVTTDPGKLAAIGDAWKASAGDKTLDAEIDRAIGEDKNDEKRLRELLKGKSMGGGRSNDYEYREAAPRQGYGSYGEGRTLGPARKGSIVEEEEKLESLRERLERDRKRRKDNGLLNSDYAERITKELEYRAPNFEPAPPSSPPIAFFSKNRNSQEPRVETRRDVGRYNEDTGTGTGKFSFTDREAAEAARERRQQRRQNRNPTGRVPSPEQKEEPIGTTRQDKYRQNDRLAERRGQRAEQRRLEEAQKQADEEKTTRREAEQRYRRQQQEQHALLQERPNGASQPTLNRFAARRHGENKQPSQTWRRPSSPPPSKQNTRNPPLPLQHQASQPWQQSRKPQSPDIGLNNGALLGDTSDDDQDLPHHPQSEQSGTLEVPIPGTPAVILKNSRKYLDKGKEKATEEQTDTWTRLAKLSASNAEKYFAEPVVVPSPILEERDSQLSPTPPSQQQPARRPARTEEEKPETATLKEMDELAGMGSVLSDSMDTSDDDFSATRELEKRLGLDSPEDTPGSTAEVGQPAQAVEEQEEATEYFDADVKPENPLSPLKEPAARPASPPTNRPANMTTARPSRTESTASGSTSNSTNATKHRPVGEPIKQESPPENLRSRKPLRSRSNVRPRTPSPPTQSASIDLNSPTLSALQREQQQREQHLPRRRRGSSNSDQTKKENSVNQTLKPSTPKRSAEMDPYDTSPDETADDTQLLLGINKKLRTVRSEVRNAYDGIENLERTLYTFENPPVEFGLDTLWYGLRKWIYRWRWFLIWPLLLTVWVLTEVSWIFWKLPPMYAGHVEGTGVPDVPLEDDLIWQYGLVGNALRYSHEYLSYGGYCIGC